MLWMMACGTPEPEPEVVVPVPQACEVGLGDEDLSAAIAAWVEASNTPGVVVGIADESGFRVEAFGVETPGGAALGEDAVFDIGSIQKSFRWMWMHRLVTLGEIGLDDPVDPPGLDLEGATWRELAQHASGLKHWDDTAFTGEVWDRMDHEFTYDEMLDYLGSDPMQPGVKAGRDMHYSNFGPMIAGHVLADGRDVQEALAEDLLDPLGLSETWIQDGGVPPAGLVPGHWDDGGNAPHAWTQDPADAMALSSAAGWLQFSTACDVLRFSHGVHDPEFISTHDELRWETVDVKDGNTDIGDAGSGLMTWPDIWGEGRWGHLGDGQHGHSSIFLHERSTGTAWVVLANVTAESIAGFEDPTTGETQDWVGDQYDTQVNVLGLVLP